LTKDAEKRALGLHADLSEKAWLLSNKNELVRKLAKNSSIDELKVVVAEFEKMAKMSPKERLIARWNSERSDTVLADKATDPESPLTKRRKSTK